MLFHYLFIDFFYLGRFLVQDYYLLVQRLPSREKGLILQESKQLNIPFLILLPPRIKTQVYNLDYLLKDEYRL